MKTISEVKKEYKKKFGTNWVGNDYRLPDLHQPKVRSDDVWNFIQSTLTEFIEALDLHEHMKVITEYTESYRDGYARAIREKLAIVDKFLGKESK